MFSDEEVVPAETLALVRTRQHKRHWRRGRRCKSCQRKPSPGGSRHDETALSIAAACQDHAAIVVQSEHSRVSSVTHARGPDGAVAIERKLGVAWD